MRGDVFGGGDKQLTQSLQNQCQLRSSQFLNLHSRFQPLQDRHAQNLIDCNRFTTEFEHALSSTVNERLHTGDQFGKVVDGFGSKVKNATKPLPVVEICDLPPANQL